jgi:homogentisate 1,2-dioxygenase
MSSNFRRGHIPRAPHGFDEHVDEIFTIDGFFGDWTHLFRGRNLGFPKRWSSDDIMYMGTDTNEIAPADGGGEPVALLEGDGIVISVSHRPEPTPFAERNADYHQIRFYHRGDFLLETELGSMEMVAGDFVVIPKGLIFRERPRTSENTVLIFETTAAVTTTEDMWDGVGFTDMFIDFSSMKLPTPGAADLPESDDETEVRLRLGGESHTLVYDFDPCRDVVGWTGDPVIYSLNVWDIPGLGSSFGFLPPPTGAVLMARDKSFFFNVMSPKPFPNVPAPSGSFGAPVHLNDYDEVWFNHVATKAPHTNGHLWRLPPSIPHPGLKRKPEYPENPVERIRELKINFDTRAGLTWTDAAREHFFPDPQVSVYTSLIGTHIGVVPEEALQHVKR